MDSNAQTQGDTDDKSITQENAENAPKGEKFQKAMESLKASSDTTPEQAPKEEELSKKDDTPSSDWEKRYKDVQAQKDKEVSQAMQEAESLARERIQEKPEYIHTLAEKNRPLADRIIKNDPDCQKMEIKNYDDLVKAIEKNKMSDETRTVADKSDKLEKEVEEIKQKLTEKEQKEAELFYAQFKEQNPEFKGDVEKSTWEMFEKSNLNLQECFDYVKFKMGIKEDINKTEEKAWQTLKSKNFAGAIPSAGSKAIKSNTSKKSLNSAEAGFLQGVGAEKTLQKYS